MSTWLLVDASYLCYRAWHSVPAELKHEGSATGVMFGFLKDVDSLIDQFVADRVVFAFDWGGPGLRGEIYPQYKAHRLEPDRSPEEQAAYEDFMRQRDYLRSRVLPQIGYSNVFRSRGYEADDIIAAVAQDLPDGVDAIIITADEDMWQCLSPRVRWYNPRQKKMVTQSTFYQEWGIDPTMWASVKALAGCKTDNVVGIAGIGEKSAAKWYTGELKPGSKKYQAIDSNLSIHNENIKLVRLPFPGLELPTLNEDEVTPAKKADAYASIGMRSNRRSRRSRQPAEGFDI